MRMGWLKFRKHSFERLDGILVSLIGKTGVMETITSRVSKALDRPLIKKTLPMLENKVIKYLKFSKKAHGEKGDGFEPVYENVKPIPLTEQELIKLAQTLEDEFRQI